MSEEYRKINEFECCGKDMVVVRGTNSCHVMAMKDWKVYYRRKYPERWQSKTKKEE